jgi:hypothetical protein
MEGSLTSNQVIAGLRRRLFFGTRESNSFLYSLTKRFKLSSPMAGGHSASSTLRPSQSLDQADPVASAEKVQDSDGVSVETDTKGLKLGLITVALCLSVFLVALVRVLAQI